MHLIRGFLLLTTFLGVILSLNADDLTRTVQKDLVALGYDPGNIQGEASTQTVVAISKFQAEHNLEVTGEVSPQLAGILKAELKKRSQPAAAKPAAAATAPTAASAAPEGGGMTTAQALCLQKKVQAREEAQKKKRGFGRLLNAVSRTSSHFGGGGLAGDVARTSGDVYAANASAEDVQAAARDLGLTEDEVEACRNPQ
jgi:peptidoglycan hydrolase-like protein with peptidoglycan-binding domain